MFFATSLGPAAQRPAAHGVYHYVVAKFPSRDSVPSYELYAAMETVIREQKLQLNAAAALDMLAQAGLLRFDAGTDTAFFTG